MALIKTITDGKGVSSTYHRIVNWAFRYGIDKTTALNVTLSSFVSAETRTSGLRPVCQRQFTIPLDGTTAVTQSWLYDQILLLPDWSDATSDVTTPQT